MGLVIRRLKGWLKSAIPTGIKERLKRKLRSRRLKGIREVEVPITLVEFEQALRKLGVAPGQVLFVHSGADWLRSVEGGPIKILELFRRILGDEGTLALPSFPFDGLAAEYIATATFDARRSPSKMGLLTELFRRLPGVRRSLHPTHPVCAVGRLAEHLTNSHHLDARPFGPSSPFGRLEEEQGKVLMLGVNSDFLTHVHVVEDSMGASFPVPVYLPDAAEVAVVNHDGIAEVLKTLVHDSAVSRLKSISRHEGEWQKKGILRRGCVGHVELRLIDAKALSAHLRTTAQQGKTIYG
jgi:aminoglycoside 3-N-acetyltransferase